MTSPNETHKNEHEGKNNSVSLDTSGINLELKQKEQLAQAEQLVDAVNHSSSVARGLYLAFISFTAFLFVITSTTDDVDLLLRTPVDLPLFGVGVDLEAFYRFAPWVYCLAHINMLMVLALLSKKLSVFHSKLSHQSLDTRQLLRTRLHVFAPVQYLSRQHGGILKLALWTISRVMLVWVPPATILWLQIDSLAMQEEGIVWFQRAALLVDAIFTYALWTRMLQGGARSLAEVRLPGNRRPATKKDKQQKFSTVIVLGFILMISFFGAMVPLSSWEQKVAQVYRLGEDTCDADNVDVIRTYPIACSNPISEFFFDGSYEKLESRLLASKGSSLSGLDRTNFYRGRCGNLDDIKNKESSEKRSISFSCWFKGKRTLDQVIELDKGMLNKIVNKKQNHFDLTIFDALSDEKEKAAKRDINATVFLNEQRYRFANLNGVLAPWLRAEDVDFSGANLAYSKINGSHLQNSEFRGADLSYASLDGAYLKKASLQGVNLSYASLKGAYLESARLERAILSIDSLQRTDLWDASLEGMNLSKVNLKGVNLRSTNLKGANLSEMSLQGIDLRGASLQGADLSGANLQGAKLSSAWLQGTKLSKVSLQGANLWKAGLQGANLSDANLQGAKLSDALLQGANLSNTNLQGALLQESFSDYAYFEGAQYSSSWDKDIDCAELLLAQEVCIEWVKNRNINKMPFKNYLGVMFELPEDEIQEITTQLQAHLRESSKLAEKARAKPTIDFPSLKFENPKSKGSCFSNQSSKKTDIGLGRVCKHKYDSKFVEKRTTYLCEYANIQAKENNAPKLLDLIISPSERRRFNLIEDSCVLTEKSASTKLHMVEKTRQLVEERHCKGINLSKVDGMKECEEVWRKVADKRAQQFLDKLKNPKKFDNE